MLYNFLIVDDSATTRAVVKRTLKMAGLPVAEIFEAANGQLGLDVAKAQKIDIILADLNMPVMGGVEMTHNLRQDPKYKTVPVIVISAEPNAQRLEQLKADGIQGYLRKPFTPEGVRNAVQTALGIAAAA